MNLSLFPLRQCEPAQIGRPGNFSGNACPHTYQRHEHVVSGDRWSTIPTTNTSTWMERVISGIGTSPQVYSTVTINIHQWHLNPPSTDTLYKINPHKRSIRKMYYVSHIWYYISLVSITACTLQVWGRLTLHGGGGHPKWKRDAFGQTAHPTCGNGHAVMTVGRLSRARNVAKSGLGTGLRGEVVSSVQHTTHWFSSFPLAMETTDWHSCD